MNGSKQEKECWICSSFKDETVRGTLSAMRSSIYTAEMSTNLIALKRIK